jgi:aldehyde dehydrogenase (NAD+)
MTLTDRVESRLWRPYVDGRWIEVDDGLSAIVENPASASMAGRVFVGGLLQADEAVAAAVRAFVAWSKVSTTDRLTMLVAFADELDKRAEEMAQLITAEVGTPIRISRRIQVGLPRTVLRATLRQMSEYSSEEQVGNSLVVREPIGVVAAITPWNYPLHQIICKVAPALAVGCTVVLKPATATPLNALALAEAADEAGLPPGVFNVITGGGTPVGEHLASHPDVDMVTFTGSTTAGRRVGALAAQTVKRVSLELGGKSACVILDDADIASAVRTAVRNGLLNSGQTCSAWTRLIVPKSSHDEACEVAEATAEAMRIGDPLDEATQMGPLISRQHRDHVVSYIDDARHAGLREVYAGVVDPEFDNFSYLAPHIFAGVSSSDRLAQEEVFGPVLAIMSAIDDDEAVAIANSTIYGLAGGVFSGDEDRALAVARRIRTGQIDINGGAFNPEAPFGGYRQSGVGRELGRHGLEEFLEIKAIQR